MNRADVGHRHVAGIEAVIQRVRGHCRGCDDGVNLVPLIHEIIGTIDRSLQSERQSHFTGEQLQFGELSVLLIVFPLQRFVLVTKRIDFGT